MKLASFWIAVMGVLAITAGTINVSYAVDSRSAIKKVRSMPEIRGAIVYKAYCVLCHGEKGDGIARATKLYGEKNLSLLKASRTRDYYEKVLRGGGLAVGLSEFMPAWQDELSEQQIDDLIYYVNAVGDPVKRGEIVFKTNCVLCHGVNGDGQGRASVLYDPKPADLTRSNKNSYYKRLIITQGGEAVGRSEVMPVWGEQISTQEINDVVEYLGTILVVPPPPE